MGGAQRKIWDAEHQHRFEKSLIELLSGTVIGKPISSECGLAEQIAADLRLAPKMVGAECRDAEADVDDVHAEEGATGSVKRAGS